ncbi:hypothetical protein ACFX14_023003 [Malus domestica]
MTNMSKSPFTDEIEQAEPSRKFNMPHFTSFKEDGDPERHLKHYRSTMKKSDHLFNVKNNPKESLRDYVKRFKEEKARIVRCNDSITSAAFQKGLLVDHPLFEELIMKEDLTLTEKHAL